MLPGTGQPSKSLGLHSSCCSQKNPCRKTYTDYSAYLQSRNCVTPGELCSLEHKISDGKLSIGHITHSGEGVRIDSDHVVAAPSIISLASGRSTELKTETTLHLHAGDPGSAPSVSSTDHGAVTVSADKSVEICADANGAPGSVVVTTTSSPCGHSRPQTQPGQIYLHSAGEGTWISEDGVFMGAGCSGWSAPLGDKSLAFSAERHAQVHGTKSARLIAGPEAAHEYRTGEARLAGSKCVSIEATDKSSVHLGRSVCVSAKLGEVALHARDNAEVKSDHGGLLLKATEGMAEMQGDSGVSLHSNQGAVTLNGSQGIDLGSATGAVTVSAHTCSVASTDGDLSLGSDGGGMVRVTANSNAIKLECPLLARATGSKHAIIVRRTQPSSAAIYGHYVLPLSSDLPSSGAILIFHSWDVLLSGALVTTPGGHEDAVVTLQLPSASALAAHLAVIHAAGDSFEFSVVIDEQTNYAVSLESLDPTTEFIGRSRVESQAAAATFRVVVQSVDSSSGAVTKYNVIRVA